MTNARRRYKQPIAGNSNKTVISAAFYDKADRLDAQSQGNKRLLYAGLSFLVLFCIFIFFFMDYPLNIFEFSYLMPIIAYGFVYTRKGGHIGRFHVFRGITLFLFFMYAIFTPWIMIYMLV